MRLLVHFAGKGYFIMISVPDSNAEQSTGNTIPSAVSNASVSEPVSEPEAIATGTALATTI